jgi:hypothetical protein
MKILQRNLNRGTFVVWEMNVEIQGVPLATEPGISLIILTPMKILQRNLNRGTFVVWEMNVEIQGVPLATEPGVSLIILTPMKILQRNLNRGKYVVWEMKRNVSVVCVYSAPNCCDTEQRSASQPGSVASRTTCIIVTCAALNKRHHLCRCVRKNYGKRKLASSCFVRLSEWNNMAPNGRIFMKFDI